MKLRYYLSGLGSGIIIAVLIMLIADKVTAVNNNVNGSNVPQETIWFCYSLYNTIG